MEEEEETRREEGELYRRGARLVRRRHAEEHLLFPTVSLYCLSTATTGPPLPARRGHAEGGRREEEKRRKRRKSREAEKGSEVGEERACPKRTLKSRSKNSSILPIPPTDISAPAER